MKRNKKVKKDKRITKLYKAVCLLATEIYELNEQRKHSGVCKTAQDMNEKYISDKLEEAKAGMGNVLFALSCAEEENKNNALFNKA